MQQEKTLPSSLAREGWGKEIYYLEAYYRVLKIKYVSILVLMDHSFKQHFLNFFPLPQGHGSLRPTLNRASAGRDGKVDRECAEKTEHRKSPLTALYSGNAEFARDK